MQFVCHIFRHPLKNCNWINQRHIFIWIFLWWNWAFDATLAYSFVSVKCLKFYKVHSEHYLLCARKNKFLETCFFTFCDTGNTKMRKKSLGPRSLAPVSYRISSFFLQNQFLLCKRYLIGSPNTLIWRY